MWGEVTVASGHRGGHPLPPPTTSASTGSCLSLAATSPSHHGAAAATDGSPEDFPLPPPADTTRINSLKEIQDKLVFLYMDFFSSPLFEQLQENERITINNELNILMEPYRDQNDFLKLHETMSDSLLLYKQKAFDRAERARARTQEMPE